MRFLNLKYLIFLSLVVSCAQAEVPNTTIKFIAPEKFTDFKTKAGIGAKDRRKLMTELKGLIVQAIDDNMPKDVKFQFAIHNIDMAGGFLRGHNDMFRVIHDTDRTSLHFTYLISDSEGKALRKDTVYLTSRNPRLLKRMARKYSRTYFPTEMALFEKWLMKLDFG